MFGRMLHRHRQRQGNDLARPIPSLEAPSLEGAIQRALSGAQGVRHGARPALPALPAGGPGAAGRRSGAERGGSRRASGHIWLYWLFWFHGCLPPEVLSALLDEDGGPGDRSA